MGFLRYCLHRSRMYLGETGLVHSRYIGLVFIVGRKPPRIYGNEVMILLPLSMGNGGFYRVHICLVSIYRTFMG